MGGLTATGATSATRALVDSSAGSRADAPPPGAPRASSEAAAEAAAEAEAETEAAAEAAAAAAAEAAAEAGAGASESRLSRLALRLRPTRGVRVVSRCVRARCSATTRLG